MTDERGHRTLYRNLAPSERLRHFATNALLNNYTLYPSEYLVITQQGYTKYYYAGGTRIASKLGSGGFEKMQRLCTEELNLTANANALFNSVVAKIGDDMPEYHISDPCPSYYSDIAGFRVQLPTLNFEPNFGITAQQNVLQAFRQNYANEETYYFHGNHLGSANWVTTATASPTQFLLHLPYGEEFVKQLNSTYDERFTFTSKEKDIETGYYYFGARFDNVDLGFMSVDPMADKYPSLTPYNYCAWNPIKLVDPEGEDWKDVDGNIIKDHSKIKVYIFYDPVSFSEQSLAMYNDAIEKYGHGTVAPSDATTEKDFAQDWQNMESNDIREINLNYHGSNQALHLDYKNEEYITSTGDGLTNKNFVQGLDITELPSIKGNIKNAQLNINSCHSNKKDENLRGSKQTLMESFYKNFKFKKVRGTSHGVSYSRFTKRPHPGHNWLNHLLEWEYLPKIKVKVNTNTSDYIGTRR